MSLYLSSGRLEEKRSKSASPLCCSCDYRSHCNTRVFLNCGWLDRGKNTSQRKLTTRRAGYFWYQTRSQDSQLSNGHFFLRNTNNKYHFEVLQCVVTDNCVASVREPIVFSYLRKARNEHQYLHFMKSSLWTTKRCLILANDHGRNHHILISRLNGSVL